MLFPAIIIILKHVLIQYSSLCENNRMHGQQRRRSRWCCVVHCYTKSRLANTCSRSRHQMAASKSPTRPKSKQ